jgi:hypothetical protein
VTAPGSPPNDHVVVDLLICRLFVGHDRNGDLDVTTITGEATSTAFFFERVCAWTDRESALAEIDQLLDAVLRVRRGQIEHFYHWPDTERMDIVGDRVEFRTILGAKSRAPGSGPPSEWDPGSSPESCSVDAFETALLRLREAIGDGGSRTAL